MGELRFDGRVAVVTGAGRGVGRAHAHLLAERGARVVVNDLGASADGSGCDPSPAQAVVEEIRASGGTAVPSMATVATAAGAEAIVGEALSTWGRIDIVISNAGFVTRSTFPEADAAELGRHLSVDPLGAFNLSRAAWPHMRAQGYGRILVTTSAAAFGSDTGLSYGTAKAANVGLMGALAAHGGRAGIHVNSLAPFAFTRMTTSHRTLAASDVELRSALAPPGLVAAAALFLVHESCPSSGGLYAAGAGRIARIVLAETSSYATAALTPEDVRDHWHELESRTEMRVIENAAAYIEHFYEKVPGATNAGGEDDR